MKKQSMSTRTIVQNCLIVLVIAFCCASCGGGGSHASAVTPPSGLSKVSMEVLFPPTRGTTDYSDVQTYLMTNPVVTGANFYVKWAVVDQGPGASPQYVFDSIDTNLQPWITADKKVNLIVWPVSDAATNDATPNYVLNNLGAANQVTCTAPNGGGSELIPNYFSSAFQQPYKAFMQAVVQHYESVPFSSSVGYIRFGLARGGETYPALGLDSDPTCQAAFAAWGLSESDPSVWTNYLTSMLDYEKTLSSPIQLMVGINSVYSGSGVPDAVAARAVQDGIGFGSQGLQESDITNYPNCAVNWCNLFNQYAGQVPLELQTLTQSDPSGAGPTGSLVTLLPFAVSHHATILELYWADWLTAFDPNYTGYAVSGSSYAQAITAAASGQ